jgi:two-component system phosphate regulon sensor histidine kinase PhoR
MGRRSSGKMLEAIVENLREAAIGIEKDGKVVVINSQGREILCDSDVDPVGRKIWDIMEMNDFIRELVALVKQSNPQPLEQIISFPGNKVFLAKMIPVPGTDGRIVGAISILADVTEIQRMEKTVNEFVAKVSHELKTPLTSIKGFVETLLEGALSNPEITRRFLQVINEETNRLTRLVINLLDLTKAIRENGSGYTPAHINTSLFISEAVRLFEPIANEKGLILSCEVPGDLPSIDANPDRLRQVIINLVDNAIKYTGVKGPGGSVRITALPNGQYLRVGVIDSGIGIPPDEKDLVFEKFYRVQKGLASQLGGTGLGLSITREIIESHGGKIELESIPGEGTKFFFTLPVSTAFKM